MIFRIIVRGRVQGVNFRNMAARYARSKGLKGRVKNLEDGSVEIIVKCNEAEKELLVGWLRSSPGFSAVREIEETPLKNEWKFEGFEIIREENIFKDKVRSVKNLGKKILKL